MPNGTEHSGCIDPTQATARQARLVIVLVSRIQKSGTGNNNFVKWKGTFRSDRPKWPDRSLWTTFKAGPEYSGRTKPKLSVPFDVLTEISGILGWMESAPKVWYARRSRGDYSTILTEPEVSNCFSMFTRSDLNRIRKEIIKKRLVWLTGEFMLKHEAVNSGCAKVGFLQYLQTWQKIV